MKDPDLFVGYVSVLAGFLIASALCFNALWIALERGPAGETAWRPIESPDPSLVCAVDGLADQRSIVCWPAEQVVKFPSK